MKVKEAMHKGVEWVGPDTPITELAKLMCAHNIGAIPIGENDRLIGMVTDRDIVCKGLAAGYLFDVEQDDCTRRDDARHPLLPGGRRSRQGRASTWRHLRSAGYR